MPFTKENARLYGSKGGKKTAETYGSEHMQKIGKLGGEKTFEEHGPEHMSAIGGRGFWATVLKHWEGRPKAFVDFLISLGLAATDAAPWNKAVEHDRDRMRSRALAGYSRLRPHWRPRCPFPDDFEPPF